MSNSRRVTARTRIDRAIAKIAKIAKITKARKQRHERQWLVPLTLDQIQTLRAGLDSERYHRSPECLRSSGYVMDLDAGEALASALFVDDDEGGMPWADYASELDALDALLATFEAAEGTTP